MGGRLELGDRYRVSVSVFDRELFPYTVYSPTDAWKCVAPLRLPLRVSSVSGASCIHPIPSPHAAVIMLIYLSVCLGGNTIDQTMQNNSLCRGEASGKSGV